MIYFNTNTNATAEFTKKEIADMKPEFRSRWREAADSEIAIHEKRAGQSAILDEHQKRREKAKAKSDKEKAIKLKKYQKDTPAPEKDAKESDSDKGSKESAESEGSK